MKNIQHNPGTTTGEFIYMLDGESVGKMTYSKMGDTKIIVDHTETDSSEKGKGIGRALVDAGVKWARENNITIIPLCPFAKMILERNDEYADVLG